MKRPNGTRRREREVESYDALIRWSSAIVLIACGIILGLAAFGDAGPLGDTLFSLAYSIVGLGAFLLPIALFAVGVYAGFGRPIIAPLTASGALLILASALAFAGIFPEGALGGQLGTWAGGVLTGFFGFWGAAVLLVALLAIGIALVSDIEAIGEMLTRAWDTLFSRAKELQGSFSMVGVPRSEENVSSEETLAEGENVEEPEHEPTVTMFNEPSSLAKTSAGQGIRNFDAEYDPPPLSLLGEDRGKPGVGDIKANANIIKRTFQNFGINVEMDEVSVGPTVTRYAIKPAEGVRLSKIVSLQNNLE